MRYILEYKEFLNEMQYYHTHDFFNLMFEYVAPFMNTYIRNHTRKDFSDENEFLDFIRTNTGNVLFVNSFKKGMELYGSQFFEKTNGLNLSIKYFNIEQKKEGDFRLIINDTKDNDIEIKKEIRLFITPDMARLFFLNTTVFINRLTTIFAHEFSHYMNFDKIIPKLKEEFYRTGDIDVVIKKYSAIIRKYEVDIVGKLKKGLDIRKVVPLDRESVKSTASKLIKDSVEKNQYVNDIIKILVDNDNISAFVILSEKIENLNGILGIPINWNKNDKEVTDKIKIFIDELYLELLSGGYFSRKEELVAFAREVIEDFLNNGICTKTEINHYLKNKSYLESKDTLSVILNYYLKFFGTKSEVFKRLIHGVFRYLNSIPTDIIHLHPYKNLAPTKTRLSIKNDAEQIVKELSRPLKTKGAIRDYLENLFSKFRTETPSPSLNYLLKDLHAYNGYRDVDLSRNNMFVGLVDSINLQLEKNNR